MRIKERATSRYCLSNCATVFSMTSVIDIFVTSFTHTLPSHHHYRYNLQTFSPSLSLSLSFYSFSRCVYFITSCSFSFLHVVKCSQQCLSVLVTIAVEHSGTLLLNKTTKSTSTGIERQQQQQQQHRLQQQHQS